MVGLEEAVGPPSNRRRPRVWCLLGRSRGDRVGKVDRSRVGAIVVNERQRRVRIRRSRHSSGVVRPFLGEEEQEREKGLL